MTVTQAIKRISVDKLKTCGFEYMGMVDGGSWLFKKNVNEFVTYEVMVIKSRFGNILDANLMMNAGKTGTFYNIHGLLEDSEFTRLNYGNAAELENAISFLTDIIITKGLDHLDKDRATGGN